MPPAVRMPRVRCRTDSDGDCGQSGPVSDAPDPAPTSHATAYAQARRLAWTRWVNASWAGLSAVSAVPSHAVDAETAQLRMRVIALENLVIALLADATDHQRTIAFEMGDFISPRPGHTPHPLTLRAAVAMRSLLERADRFRPGPPD